MTVIAQATTQPRHAHISSLWHGEETVFTSTSIIRAVATDNDYFKLDNFVLDIPVNTTIKGIVLAINYRIVGRCEVAFETIQLLKNGIPVGSNKADPTSALPPRTTSATPPARFGSTADLWGTTWTPAEINDNEFGVQIRAVALAPLLPSLFIDGVDITVYYEGSSQAALDQYTIPSTAELSFSTEEHNVISSIAVDMASLTLTSFEVTTPELVTLAVLQLQPQDAKIDDLVSPDTAALTLNSFAAVVGGIVSVPVPAALSLGTFNALIDDLVAPDLATLALTSPQAKIDDRVLAVVGSLVLVSYDAAVLYPEIISVETAELFLQTFEVNTPTIIHVASPGASLTLTSFEHEIVGTTRVFPDLGTQSFESGDHIIT